MASRSWNKVELMGNLTRDPELRYTPNGAAVCTFGIATNRTYLVEGERKEEVDFHRVVAWGKLAELCNQLLKKGAKVFVSGRLQYREWETQEGQKRRDAEISIDDMILVTPKNGMPTSSSEDINIDDLVEAAASRPAPARPAPVTNDDTSTPAPSGPTDDITLEPQSEPAPAPKADETVGDEDLPF